MLFNLNAGAFTKQSYQFPGNSDFARSGADYMIVLESSSASGSTFRLLKSIARADICLVAGGAPGKDGYYSTPQKADGGNGGEVLNITNVSLPAGDYTAIVGESGKNTVLTSPNGTTWTARSGSGADGGHAEGVGDAVNGRGGEFAWGDSNTLLRKGWKYGSGGGAGYVLDYNGHSHASGNGGDVGTASADESVGRGGQSESSMNGNAGASGTGQGGGGSASVYNWGASDYTSGTPGAGGSGAILIRKHKEANA